MRRLGIVVALPAEARCLVNRRIKPGASIELDEGVCLVLAGVGHRRARAAAEALVRDGAQALLSWGTAGALVPILASSTLLLPATVLEPQNARLGVDAAWRARLITALGGRLTYHDGTLVQSTQVLAHPEDKARLAAGSGAVAVDMESAAIAAVASAARVPFLAVRVIADAYERLIPSDLFGTFDAYGRIRPQALARALLTRPRLLADALRLAQDLRAACVTLREVRALAGPRLQLE